MKQPFGLGPFYVAPASGDRFVELCSQIEGAHMVEGSALHVDSDVRRGEDDFRLVIHFERDNMGVFTLRNTFMIQSFDEPWSALPEDAQVDLRAKAYKVYEKILNIINTMG